MSRSSMPRMRSDCSLGFWLAVLAAYTLANLAVTWFCRLATLSDLAHLTEAANLDAPPRLTGALHCLLAALEVNTLVTGGVVMALIIRSLERRRRQRLGLPGTLSEALVYNPARRGVVLRIDLSGPRPRRTIRLDPRVERCRPSRRTSRRL